MIFLKQNYRKNSGMKISTIKNSLRTFLSNNNRVASLLAEILVFLSRKANLILSNLKQDLQSRIFLTENSGLKLGNSLTRSNSEYTRNPIHRIIKRKIANLYPKTPVFIYRKKPPCLMTNFFHLERTTIIILKKWWQRIFDKEIGHPCIKMSTLDHRTFLISTILHWKTLRNSYVILLKFQ